MDVTTVLLADRPHKGPSYELRCGPACWSVADSGADPPRVADGPAASGRAGAVTLPRTTPWETRRKHGQYLQAML